MRSTAMKQHSQRFLNLVNECKKHINELNSQELKLKLEQHEPLHLIDVREESEWANGKIPGAIHLSKGTLERDIEKKIPNLNEQIITYCSGGFRSALAAESLQKMGYSRVYSLNAGFQGWMDAGYSIAH
jgi:rhodanese-related sulfurtransferase